MAVVTVDFSELDTYLASLPANTPETAYELNIINIPNEFSYDLPQILGENRNKYVSLSETLLPNSYTKLVGYFGGCTSLVTAPVIPDSVTDMILCFENCTSLTTVPVIPDSVINMGGCFEGCASLTTVPVIPNSVISLNQCFYGCTSLTTVPVIPNSVTDISYCFRNCIKLTTIPVIPNSVTDMEGCFYDCISLVTAPVIPDSVTSLSSCFYGCTSLTTAPVIPNSVTSLSSCFYDCTSLITVPIIPDSVTNMAYCFNNCTSLKNIDSWKANPSTYKNIFKDCTSLEKIGTENEYQRMKVNTLLKKAQSESYNNIPQSINLDAVVQCDNNIVPFENLDGYLTIAPNNTVNTPYVVDITGLTNEVCERQGSPFVSPIASVLRNYPTKYISLQESLESITSDTLNNTFNNCSSIVSFSCENNTIKDMEGTFYNCTNLKTVTKLPNNIETLTACFWQCSSLESICIIPDSVSTYDGCFMDCSSLITVQNIPESSTGNLSNLFLGCSSLKRIEIFRALNISSGRSMFRSAKIEYIGTDNEYCRAKILKNLKDIQTESYDNIPKTINLDTVVQCDNNIVPFPNLDDYLTVVPANTPENAYDINITEIPINKIGSSSESGTLGNIIESHNDKYLILKDTLIPYGVTNMYDCFDSCRSLIIAPVIPNSVTVINYCFSNCISLTTAPVIPDSVTNMSCCFNYCSSLTTAPVIPQGVTNMSYCFDYCTSLTTAPVIPQGVTNMSYCFYNCINLTEISSFNIPYERIIENPDNFTDMLKNTSPDLVIKLPVNYETLPEYNLLKVDVSENNVTVNKYTKVNENTVTSRSVEVPITVGDKMEFGNATDEIVISSNISDDTVSKMLRRKYQWGLTGLDPDGSNFVLWAREGSNVISNVTGGGEGGTVYSVPVGTIMSYSGSLDKLTSDWKVCNGEVLNKKDYPDLYDVLPEQYIIDDKTFRLPDLTDRFIQGANDTNFSENIEAGLPNIKGSTGSSDGSYNGIQGHSTTSSGAFSVSKKGNASWSGSTGSCFNLSFNASNGETDTNGNLKTDASTKVYGKSNTVQPPAVALYFIIKATKYDEKQLNLIDDKKVTTSNVWSALKTQAEILKGGSGVSLDDSTISNTSVWSSEKINAEIAAIDNKNNYSTEEIIIGTFLDKPLYRRFIYFTSPASTVQNGTTFTEGASMPIGTVSIIQDIVTCKIFRFTNNKAMISLSCMRTSDIQFKVYTHEAFSNCDAMSLEYTKTTD